jgi:hypothetical protein
VYEAQRFEDFKLDLYKLLYRYKYSLVGKIGVERVDDLSRMKRQLTQAACIEGLTRVE